MGIPHLEFARNDRRHPTAPNKILQFGITSNLGEWNNQVDFAHLQRIISDGGGMGNYGEQLDSSGFGPGIMILLKNPI